MSQPQLVLNAAFFAEIRIILTQAQQKVSSAASVAMVEAFWQIGRRIVEEEQRGEKRAKYGKQVLKELSKQLTQEFGNGFSISNLEYMRKFYLIYRERSVVKSQTLSGILPLPTETNEMVMSGLPFSLSWSHYVLLIGIKDPLERDFYEIEAVRQGWSLRELKR